MKAAVVHDFRQPLRIEDIPTPEPGPGQVVVKIETSGLCHTDMHAAHGDWPIKPTLPFVPGHEGVGRVERIGPGVSDLHEGDLVAVPWLGRGDILDTQRLPEVVNNCRLHGDLLYWGSGVLR